MAKKLKLNFALKSNADKTKPAIIYAMFTLGGKRYKLSLGYSVVPEFWQDNNRIEISSKQTQTIQRQMKRINRFLDAFEEKVSRMLDVDRLAEYERQVEDAGTVDKYGIVAKLKRYIDEINGIEKEEEQQRTITPLEYFEKTLADMPKKVVRRTSKIIESNTVGHHGIVLKRYKKFLQFKGWGNGSFSQFDKNFEAMMEQWMLGEAGYSSNTVAATFSVMKIWLKQAEEDGLITDKSFHSWKSKGTDVQHIYLTEDELKKIAALDFSEIKRLHPNANYDATRDLFIIAANIGLRFGDLGSLNRCNWDIENRTVEIHTHKTGATVLVPLSSIVIAIYKKYDGKLPSPMEKGKYNAQLRKIGEMAGISQTIYTKRNVGGKVVVEEKKKYELISSHTARRSFATNLYKRCKNPRMVMAFTGHTTEENFRKYICIEKDEMVDMAMQYFD